MDQELSNNPNELLEQKSSVSGARALCIGKCTALIAVPIYGAIRYAKCVENCKIAHPNTTPNGGGGYTGDPVPDEDDFEYDPVDYSDLDDKNRETDGLSTGAIIAISVGALVVLGLTGLLIAKAAKK